MKTPPREHPLEHIALKALATGAQDAITLIVHLSGQSPPPTAPLLNAYKRVAKDVLDNLEARGLASRDGAGWYRASVEPKQEPATAYNLRNWRPQRLFKDSPITGYEREEQGRQTRWQAEAKPDGESWRVVVWRLERGWSLRSHASGEWVWSGFSSWEEAARFAEEFIQLRRNPQTWKTATNEQRNRLSEMESKAISARA
jgi:hypothetical protein